MGNNPCPSYGRQIPYLVQQILNSNYDIKKSIDDDNIVKLLQFIESSLRELKKVAQIVNPKLKRANLKYHNQRTILQFYYVLNSI